MLQQKNSKVVFSDERSYWLALSRVIFVTTKGLLIFAVRNPEFPPNIRAALQAFAFVFGQSWSMWNQIDAARHSPSLLLFRCALLGDRVLFSFSCSWIFLHLPQWRFIRIFSPVSKWRAIPAIARIKYFSFPSPIYVIIEAKCLNDDSIPNSAIFEHVEKYFCIASLHGITFTGFDVARWIGTIIIT